MLALFLALQLSPPPTMIDGLPIGGLAPQSLPAKGCAAYLFSAGQTRTFAAMATADPGALRILLDGKVTDVARATASGNEQFGLGATTEYRGDGLVATLDMNIVPRSDLTGGATVPDATLRIDRTGHDSIVMPLGGLVGCAVPQAVKGGTKR